MPSSRDVAGALPSVGLYTSFQEKGRGVAGAVGSRVKFQVHREGVLVVGAGARRWEGERAEGRRVRRQRGRVVRACVRVCGVCACVCVRVCVCVCVCMCVCV